MIDMEKRVIVFGDGDLSVTFNPFGMAFANSKTLEDEFEITLFVSVADVSDLCTNLEDMENKEELERTFNQTTFKFISVNDVKELRRCILIWGLALAKHANEMEEYVKGKLETDFPEVDTENILNNEE